MGFGLGDLNPTNWSIDGHSLAPSTVEKNLSPFNQLAVLNSHVPTLGSKGSKLYNLTNNIKEGWSATLNDPTSLSKWQRMADPGMSNLRALITGDTGFRDPAVKSFTQNMGLSDRAGMNAAAGIAALFAGGAAAEGAFGGSSGSMTSDQMMAAGYGTGTEAGSAALPAGGMTATGTTSAADAASMGVGTQAGDVGATAAATDTAGAAATKAGMSLSQKIALGLAGVNALGGILNKPKPINTDPYGVGANANTTANKLLDNFNKGQLQPQDQYNIAKWQQDQLQVSKDYYAKAGLADSSMATEAAAGISQQAEAMKGQALTNMMNNGLSAAGVANQYTTQQVNQQVAQDQQLQQSQSNFMQTLAMYGMMA